MNRVVISGNGRYAVWYCTDSTVPYLTDRDADGDGVFDEPSAMSKGMMGLRLDGQPTWGPKSLAKKSL